MTKKIDFHNANALFKSDFQSSYIFHIPHSSPDIPDVTHFNQKYLKDEVELLTDWKVDEIFKIDGIKKVIANFSRVYCDVERLSDEEEPMFEKGAGFYYTKTDKGEDLRILDGADKRFVYNRFYIPHHQSLENTVIQTVQEYGYASIIDCHSFSNAPLEREFNQYPTRPDICLGIDGFHTPDSLTREFVSFFTSQGLSVAINIPYTGTIVPLSLYQKDTRVKSIMIEINKRLYMNEETLEFYPEKITSLKQVMQKLFFA